MTQGARRQKTKTKKHTHQHVHIGISARDITVILSSRVSQTTWHAGKKVVYFLTPRVRCPFFTCSFGAV